MSSRRRGGARERRRLKELLRSTISGDDCNQLTRVLFGGEHA
jgi:hypothetical protein